MNFKLQPGDRIISRCITGVSQYFSDGIAWWLHSNWSHTIPVVSETEVLDISWPKPKIVPASTFLSGDYKVKVLRPCFTLTPNQVIIWENTINDLLNQRYDLESYAGFILNDAGLQNSKRVNCAEGTLICDKTIGLLPNYDGRLVSPQSYENFANAGLFNVIYDGTCKNI
jgi:hypothetical protein